MSSSNAGVATFVGCWMAFFVYFVASGAFDNWTERLPLARSFTNALGDPFGFFLRLGAYPFAHSRIAIGVSVLTAVSTLLVVVYSRTRKKWDPARVAGTLALLLTAPLIFTFRFETDLLPTSFAQLALISIVAGVLVTSYHPGAINSEVRFLLLLSGLGAFLYATFTYYFSPYRSWISGILALPFGFSVGLSLLLQLTFTRAPLLRFLTLASLVVGITCVAQEHYRLVQRDARPADLNSEFRVPKLRSIRSTAERVHAVDQVYEYLRPRLARRETLLVYDDCPMLYFLLDVRPAYGLSRALRYALTPEVLVQLDRELNAKPLPNYAVRTLTDLSYPVWHTAPRINYDNYPLNETVMANYVLERTIFPFEIWRLKSVSP